MDFKKNNDKDFFKQRVEFRGYMLEYVSVLEYQLNEYIANFLCKRERIEDMLLLLLGDDRITLGKKAEVFYQIAKKYDSKWYNSYSAKGEPTMNNELVKIIEQRNVFAHRIADVDFSENKKSLKGTIRFIKLKNSIDEIEYNNGQFSDLLDKTLKMINHFANREKLFNE